MVPNKGYFHHTYDINPDKLPKVGKKETVYVGPLNDVGMLLSRCATEENGKSPLTLQYNGRLFEIAANPELLHFSQEENNHMIPKKTYLTYSSDGDLYCTIIARRENEPFHNAPYAHFQVDDKDLIAMLMNDQIDNLKKFEFTKYSYAGQNWAVYKEGDKYKAQFKGDGFPATLPVWVQSKARVRQKIKVTMAPK